MTKQLTILGAGESGTGAALLAKAKGYDVFVSDRGAVADIYKAQLVAHDIAFEEGYHSEERIVNSDLVIKSPGIPDSADLVIKLRVKGVEIIDELEFASRYTDAKLIAITGTNGKTTTTLLTYHLLKEAGLNVGLAGNIGDSLAKQVIVDQYEYYVLEMSSFQIDGISSLTPEMVVMLNITPDHLDRYEYDFDKYAHSKFRLIDQLNGGSLIYYADDKVISSRINNHAPSAKLIDVSLINSAKASFDGNLMNFGAFSIDQRDTTLKGTHNLINTMSAVSVVLELGVSEEKIRKALKTFSNAPHRLEYVTTINDVAFYNDSKATNVESTKHALESFDEQLVWIAGGVDKGNNYQYIMEQVNAKVKALVCLGKDNEKLRNAFHEEIIDLLETDDINKAVESAMQYAEAHDVVLLSPACASFDLFKSYEDRGDQFKNAVMMLKETYNN